MVPVIRDVWSSQAFREGKQNGDCHRLGEVAMELLFNEWE